MRDRRMVRICVLLTSLAAVLAFGGSTAQAILEPPALTSPAFNQNVPGTVITFQWARSVDPSVNDYWLQVARDSGFTDLAWNGEVGNFLGFQLYNLLDNGQGYYWRVASGYAGQGWGYFPANYSYVINGPSARPSTPVLTSPANTSKVNGTQIQFNWSGQRALNYYISIYYDSALTQVAYQGYLNSVPSFLFYNLLDNGQTFYWAVAAWNPLGWSNPVYSSTWRVTNGPSSLPTTPSLTSPANGAKVNGSQIQMNWSALRALNYYIVIYYDSAFTQVAYADWTNSSTPSFLFYGLPDNGQVYYWKVSAWNPLGYSNPQFSGIRNVTNGPSGPPGPTTLSSPASGSTVAGTTIQFRWNPSARALDYYVMVAEDAAFTKVGYARWNNTDFPGVDITNFPDNGLVLYWKVAAWNPLISSNPATLSFSSTWTVTNGPSSSPTVPVPTAPANGAFVPGSTVTFSWNAASRAAGYDLEIALDSSFAFLVFSQPVGNVTTYPISGFTTDDRTYYWHVRATNPAGKSTYSSPAWSYVNGIGACAEATGSGNGVISFQTQIDTCFANPTYYMQDISRRASSPSGHFGRMPDSSSIKTRLFFTSTIADVMADPDNSWTASTQSSGVDAQVYTGYTYDYLNLSFNQNSIDGLGSMMRSLVEFPLPSPNAFWDDSTFQIIIGKTTGYLPFSGALDAISHEWGHAVTSLASTRPLAQVPWQPGNYTKALFYGYQSGALNEAFSDWLGTAVENAHGEHNWTIGEGILILRDMQNPKAYQQPDTVGGQYYLDYNSGNCIPDQNTNDSCGVHTNSGVPNKVFSLLSDGGTHNTVAVQGIGVSNAIAIAYRANMRYWPNDATFQVARDGMVSAANDLFPGDPNMVNQVRNAWAAVGVGTVPVITVTASPSAGGSVSGGGSYSFGASATVTATPNAGYQFTSWVDNGLTASINPAYTFTVSGSRSLTANFLHTVQDIAVSPTSFDFGHYVIGQISPAQGFIVTNRGFDALQIASVNLSGGSATQFTKTIENCTGAVLSNNQSCIIQVRFTPTSTGLKQTTLNIQSNDPDTPSLGVPLSGTGDPLPTYTITASAGTGGTITPSGAISVTSGGSQSFTIAASAGYYTANVTVDGLSQGPIGTYTFSNVTADHTISASFFVQTYTITSSTAGGGTIAPIGDTVVAYGGSQTYTMTPNTGNSIRDVRVDGVSVGAVSTYTFNAVTASHAIVASFSSLLTVGSSGAGTGTITSDIAGINCGADCSEAYPYGTVVTLTAAPSAGLVFAGWYGGGCGGTGTCTLAMTTNTSVIAYFNLASNPPASGATLVSDIPSPAGLGSIITFTGTGSGGSGTYEYEFVVKLSSATDWTTVQAYSSNNVFVWDTRTNYVGGVYSVAVHVRNVGGLAAYEAAATVSYTLTVGGGGGGGHKKP